MDEERVIPDQTLVVKNGKIISYGDKDTVVVDKNVFIIDAKYASIDHLDGFVEAITPVANEMTENEIGLFAAWIATQADTSLIPKLMNALRANDVYVVPTEALVQRWLSPFPASHFEGDPEFKYMNKEVINAWMESKNKHYNNPRFNKKEAEEFIKLRMKLINDCQKYGVKLLLGSDAPQVFNVPGFSIHREMEYMVNSGLTPYEVLLSGTVNVASYLNKNDSGTIKPGNVSDPPFPEQEQDTPGVEDRMRPKADHEEESPIRDAESFKERKLSLLADIQALVAQLLLHMHARELMS